MLSFWLILTLTVVFWSLFPQYAWYNAVGKKVFVVGEKVCGWNWGETRDRRSDVGEVGSARVGREGIEMGVLGNRGVPGVVQSERGTRRKFGETGWRRLD